MHFFFLFIFTFQLFACNYSLIQHSTNFSSESFQALHNHLSSLPFIKRQTSPSQIYNVSILVSIDGTPKQKEFDETLKLVKVFDTINLKMRQAGFNEPIIQFFVEKVIFDSKDKLRTGIPLINYFHIWANKFQQLYKTKFMLGVEFVRRHTFDAIGVTWSDVLCSSSAATVVSGYDPDSDDQVYMTTLIHETLHTLGVDHTEDWIQMKNKNLIKKGKKPNFTCGVNDLMSAYENGSHKVNKCTIEQLALFLGKYENKKQCLKASPFNPNAASVNPLLTGITKNESSGSNNSKSGGNPPPVVPGKNNVKKPDIIPNQTSEVSTTVSSPPLVSTTVSRPPLVSTTVSRPPLVSTTVSSPPLVSTTVSRPPLVSTTVSSPPLVSTTVSSPPLESTTVSSPPLVSTTVSSPPRESTTVSGPPLESTVVSSPPLESTVVSTSLIVSTTDVSTSFSSPPILSTTTEVSTIPPPLTIIPEPPVGNINVDPKVVTEDYPDVISNPRIPRCNN